MKISKEFKLNNKENIERLLVDMVYKTPVEVYRKYGIGFQTQDKIKGAIVLSIPEKEIKEYQKIISCIYKT